MRKGEERWEKEMGKRKEKEKKKKKKKKRLPAWNDHSGKSLSYCCLKYFDQ